MAETDLDFANLMKKVQAGCPEAAEQLHATYGQHILRAVRRKLHPKLRSKFDSIDFVQDVWASFFADVPQNYTFAEPRDLVAFLIRLAKNKVAQAVRTRLIRAKHNINREQPLDISTGPELAAKQATVSEIVMGREEWDKLLKGQPLVYRRILMLVREGKPSSKIAAELGVTQQTVNRVIRRLLPQEQS